MRSCGMRRHSITYSYILPTRKASGADSARRAGKMRFSSRAQRSESRAVFKTLRPLHCCVGVW